MRWAVIMLVVAGCYQRGSFPAQDAPAPDEDAQLIEHCVGDTDGFVVSTCFTNPVPEIAPLIELDTDASCDESATTDFATSPPSASRSTRRSPCVGRARWCCGR